MTRIVVGVAWVAANLALALLCRGSFGQGVILVMASFVAVGCGLLGGLSLLFDRSTWVGWAGRKVLFLAALLVGLWASLPFGMILNGRDVAEAKAYCESLIPAIERHKAETGRYPEYAPAPPGDVARPRLLDRLFMYHADDDGYSFGFIDPSGMLDSFEYRSVSREWYAQD